MEKILIFGASQGGQRGLHALPKGRKAVAFVDNDAKKHGTRFMGLPVIGPAQIGATPHDRILIASTYQKEILAQLRQLGVTMEKVDLIDPDVLTGAEDPPLNVVPWAIGGVILIALAIYGLIRLLFG